MISGMVSRQPDDIVAADAPAPDLSDVTLLTRIMPDTRATGQGSRLTLQVPGASNAALVENVDLAQALLRLDQVRRGGHDELRLALEREEVGRAHAVLRLEQVLGVRREQRRVPVIWLSAIFSQ